MKILFLAVIAFSFLPVSLAQAKERRKDTSVVICKSPSVNLPKGFIIRSESTGKCSGSEPSAWVIDKVGEKDDVVCRATPIPEDYVVVAEVESKGCPEWSGGGRSGIGGSSAGIRYNAWEIERVSRESKKEADEDKADEK